MKIRPVGGESFYADGRTDRQTDRQTDRHFVNAPKTIKCM